MGGDDCFFSAALCQTKMVFSYKDLAFELAFSHHGSFNVTSRIRSVCSHNTKQVKILVELCMKSPCSVFDIIYIFQNQV